MELIRLRLLASAGFVLVMILSACSDGGDPTDSETTVPGSAEGETPAGADSETQAPDGDDGADADSTTEPEAPQADGQRIGGEMVGFTVELPAGWLDVPTDDDMIDAFVEQEDIPDDVASSMELVVGDGGLGEESLLAYGGTENDVDIFLIASCGPDDGSLDDHEDGNATVDGIPAARSTATDSDRSGPSVWLSYRFLAGDELCWVRFPAPDESWFARFDDIVATIDVCNC